MNTVIGLVAVVLGCRLVASCRAIAKRERRRLDRIKPGIVRVGAPNEASIVILGLMIVVLGLILLG